MTESRAENRLSPCSVANPVQHLEYRKLAAACLEIANAMSLHSDRLLMIRMAQEWLELAQKREAENASRGDETTPS
jgi:hypothetical protein